jgi:hypothetical protein
MEGFLMSFSWGRVLRHVFIALFVVGGSSTAFALDQQGRPQSPVESYLARGNDGGMVMPVSYDEAVSCSGTPVAAACCGDNNCWCGEALDYFAPGSDNCGCSTWTFGAELLFLKGFNSAGAFGDLDYRAGVRFWGAWQRPDGLGVRLRYFDYDNQGAVGLVDTDSLDIEAMDSLQLGCNWTLIVAGGVRFTDFVTVGGDFHGIGPVVSAELYRTINCNTQLYGITRAAILVDDGANPGGLADSTISVSEIQIGIQRTRELQSGALAFGRVGYEAQWYDDVATGGTSSVTLHGFAFSLGVIY